MVGVDIFDFSIIKSSNGTIVVEVTNFVRKNNIFCDIHYTFGTGRFSLDQKQVETRVIIKFRPILPTKETLLIVMGFSKPPILNIFSQKFQGLVLW